MTMRKSLRQNNEASRSNSNFILAILFLGFVLRLWGVQFGLPHLYHADEPIVVNHAMAYGTGDFNPHFFKIPPLVSYLLFGLYGLYFSAGKAIGQFHSIHEFALFFLTDPSSFYLLGRIIFGACLGTATIFAFYRSVQKFFSGQLALLCAFFLAINFLHVRDSHYIYVDIPLVFILILAFFPILKIAQKAKLKDYLIFGILAGAAVAVKYNGVFIFVPFVMAHVFGRTDKTVIARPAGTKQSQTWLTSLLGLFRPPAKFRGGQARNAQPRYFFFACAASVFTFFILNPFSLLDFKFFTQELHQQAVAEGGVGFFHHLTYSLNESVGFLVLFAAFLGMILSLRHRDTKRWVFLSFVIVYYLVLCFFSQPYDRYVLPLIPWVVFFASDFLIFLAERYRLVKKLIVYLAVFVALPSLWKMFLCNQIFSEKDVRTQAQEWIEKNLPAGEKIALDVPFFMPRLKPTLKQLEEKRDEVTTLSVPDSSQLKRLDLLISSRLQKESKSYELYYLRPPAAGEEHFLFAKPSVPYDLESLKRLGIRNIIVTTINLEHNAAFYQDLQKQAGLLKRFSPFKDESRQWAVDALPLTGAPFLLVDLLARKRNGQIIEIYRMEV